MTHHLELQKQQVKYWSRITSLILASLPLIYNLVKKPKDAGLDQTVKKTIDLLFWFLLLLLAVITYLVSNYTLSSLFWPAPLSLTNHLLLIPTTVYTGIRVWDHGKLLFS